MSVLESMITATITRPDPLIALMEGFRRSMNLDESITFLPGISKNDLKSALYLTKVYHDTFFNMYINNMAQIPSSFTILKYQIP